MIRKSLVISSLALLLLSACDNINRYQYIEISAERVSLDGVENIEKEPKVIKASSDSAAYMAAFQSFCIALKVNEDMKQTRGKVYSTPLKFKLLNENGEDIASTVYFSNKVKREKEIREKIFALKNSIQESVDKSKVDDLKRFQDNASIDSAKVQNLKPHFRINKDAFSNNNIIWYKPNSAPLYTNRNALYCYFQTENGMPGNLRMRFQYYAEDWLFFSRILFAIDGKAYEFIPEKTETDSPSERPSGGAPPGAEL
jgi:hypothetical protein